MRVWCRGEAMIAELCRAQAGYELLIVAARQSAEVLGVARAAGRPGPRFRSRATRGGWVSTFISKMVAWWTSRSIAASVMAGSGKTLPHSPKGWLAVIRMEGRLWGGLI